MIQQTNHPLICHLLIGPPAAGKSTFAQQWLDHDSEIVWVSTDRLREELFGSAEKQESWDLVSAEVDRRIRSAIAEGKSVIYDATNVQRAWRLEFLEKYASDSVVWVGWWFKTNEADCKQYNRNRSRQVPDWVIEKAIANLKQLPPDPAEGLVLINEINTPMDFPEKAIDDLPQTIRKRQTAILNSSSKLTYHGYSRLLDFERLVYLILVLMRYPGAGNLRETEPQRLATALQCPLDTLPVFADEVGEISAILRCQYGAVYANPAAIEANLDWLQKNGFINSPECQEPLIFQEYTGEFNPLLNHRYADWELFRRVMEVTRYLAYAPLFKESKTKLSTMLVEQFKVNYSQLSWLTEASLRRDITEFFIRYGFWQNTAKQGYFLGVGILPKEDLENLALTLKVNTPLHNNPIQLESYSRFTERMSLLRKQDSKDQIKKGLELDSTDDSGEEEPYPSRTILHRQLSDELSLHTIETYVDQAKVLLLERQPGRGQYGGDVEDGIAILPLQIAFHKIDWYLGYVVVENGENEGLLRFDRLARWSLKQYPEMNLDYRQIYQGDKGFQRQRLKDLQKLLEVSYSPFIGRNPQEQQQVLSEGKRALKPLELWFADNIFNVVSLATKRFPELKMSPRSYTTQKERDEVFTLKPTGDERFPYRLRAKLAPWALETDFDLEGWILRFAGQVKVIEPLDLAERILRKALATAEVYQDQGSSE